MSVEREDDDYGERYAAWWQSAAREPGTRFVDLLTWCQVMIERQDSGEDPS